VDPAATRGEDEGPRPDHLLRRPHLRGRAGAVLAPRPAAPRDALPRGDLRDGPPGPRRPDDHLVPHPRKTSTRPRRAAPPAAPAGAPASSPAGPRSIRLQARRHRAPHDLPDDPLRPGPPHPRARGPLRSPRLQRPGVPPRPPHHRGDGPRRPHQRGAPDPHPHGGSLQAPGGPGARQRAAPCGAPPSPAPGRIEPIQGRGRPGRDHHRRSEGDRRRRPGPRGGDALRGGRGRAPAHRTTRCRSWSRCSTPGAEHLVLPRDTRSDLGWLLRPGLPA
jgi:hypothetical protein